MCQEFKRNSDFHHWELWERDLIVTLAFSSLFSIKISLLLPVDVGTLPNNVKSYVFWLCGDYSFNCLLVVDFLRFRFRRRVFDSVFLCCLIGDRLQHKEMVACLLRALADRLLTKSMLRNFNIIQNDVCVLRNASQEDRDHLFFNCPFSSYIWSLCKIS